MEETVLPNSRGSLSPKPVQKPQIWWSNGIFFVGKSSQMNNAETLQLNLLQRQGLHIMAIYGVIFLSPPTSISWKTWLLCFISWQLASFG